MFIAVVVFRIMVLLVECFVLVDLFEDRLLINCTPIARALVVIVYVVFGWLADADRVPAIARLIPRHCECDVITHVQRGVVRKV